MGFLNDHGAGYRARMHGEQQERHFVGKRGRRRQHQGLARLSRVHPSSKAFDAPSAVTLREDVTELFVVLGMKGADETSVAITLLELASNCQEAAL